MRLEFVVLQNNSTLKGTYSAEGCKKEKVGVLTHVKLDQYNIY